MDFDPRITSDGDGLGAAYGVHCNFHYGYVHDVFDEDVKNEDACVQALRHLIAKADSEIADLEDELAILQCQRKWAESDEHNNPFVVCCAAFKQRISSLTSASQRLRNGVDTVSEVQRPAERICDIIDALIKINFTETDEEEGDLYDDMILDFISGSLNIDIDVKQEATSLELSVESEKQTPVLGRPHKPTQTVSEESCSDAAIYMTNDFTDKISKGPCNVKVSEKIRSAELASEEKSGSLTSVETVAFRSPLQASNDEENSKPTATQCGEIEMIKAEQDDHDTNIQHDPGVGSISRVQNHELKYPVEGHLTVLENGDQSVSDLEITYGRRKTTLRPLGQNLPRTNLDDIRPSSSSLRPMSRKTTTKRKSSFMGGNFGHSGILSFGLKGDCGGVPETNWLKELETEENVAVGNSLQVSRAKKRQPVVKVPEGNVEQSLQGRDIVCLKSRTPEEVKASAIACLTDTLNPSSTTEVPVILESWRKRLSEEPSFLEKLKVKELRAMAKLCSFTGVSKDRKDKLIKDLSKYLSSV
ncbi:hypothetical protein KSS87_005248 [Heliosperma pusillum]|nr:hypothetical protein KSS87_005248 [Heliosperma pusillum]